MSEPPNPEPEDFLRENLIREDKIIHAVWNDGSITRLTTAFGGLRLPNDHIEEVPGAYYACAPFLLDLPAFRSLVNGVADLVGLQISDVQAAIAALTADHADLAEGAIINVGKVFWDRDWQMIGGARWGFAGQGGELKLERKAGRISADGEVGPMQRTIELTIASQMVMRSGSYRSYWSAPQHKELHPTDEIFSQGNKINVGYNKNWPKF